MFNKRIAGFSLLTAIALVPLAAFSQELKIEENTPGTSLRMDFAGLNFRPNSTYGYEAYRMTVDGFPRGVELHLWVLSPGSSVKSATPTRVGVSLKGLILQLGTTTPFELSFPTEPKGMTYYIGLTTLDGAVRCWTRLRRRPIEVRDGPCLMSAEVASGMGDSYSLSGRGFQPGEDLRITTKWLQASQEGHGTARPDGTWKGRVTLADTGQRSLKVNVTIASQSCTLKLELERISVRP